MIIYNKLTNMKKKKTKRTKRQSLSLFLASICFYLFIHLERKKEKRVFSHLFYPLLIDSFFKFVENSS